MADDTSANRQSRSVLTSANRRGRYRSFDLGEAAVDIGPDLGEAAVDIGPDLGDAAIDLGEAAVETKVEEAEHRHQDPQRGQLERHQAGDGAPECGWIDSHHARNVKQSACRRFAPLSEGWPGPAATVAAVAVHRPVNAAFLAV
jgi:hypothetical protein